MKTEKIKICADKAIIAVASVCVIASCCMIGYEPSVRTPKDTPPIALLILSLYTLLQEWHTVVLDECVLFVKYYPTFFERKVLFDDIGSVEHIRSKRNEWLVITLKGCPAFADSKYKEASLYIAMHPVKVIAARCSKEEGELWATAIRERMTNSTGNSTGDGSVC